MEIDLIFKIAAVGIIVSILNQVLSRSGRDEQATMTTLAGLVVVLMILAQKIADLFDLVKTGGKTAVKNVLKQAGVEGTEEGFSYVFNLLADKVAKDPNAQFNWDELLQSIASGAISGLFFGAAGTAANRGQADPGVIVQTGKEKQALAGTSLHLADGQVQGLPVAEKPVGDVESLPLPTAILSHAGVLYLDYLMVYLLNSWLPRSAIGVFTAVFFVGFALVWLVIYLCIRAKTRALNEKMVRR